MKEVINNIEYNVKVGSLADLPSDIQINQNISKYKEYRTQPYNDLLIIATRKPTDKDIPAVLGRDGVKVQPVYYGEWEVKLYTNTDKKMRAKSTTTTVATRTQMMKVRKGCGVEEMSIEELEEYLKNLKGGK